MATRIKHDTLVTSTVKTITLDGGYVAVEVVNVDAAGDVPIYVTVDGTAPTVAGDECDVVAGVVGAALTLGVRSGARTSTVVKLIAAGTPKICVKGLDGLGGIGRR